LDGRSDLYSLGVVAYQCLAGSVPFDGEDSFAIGYKHIMEELPTPSLETPDKRSLFDIIRKMMAKLPDDRFQDADDLVQALEGGAFAPLALATAPTRAIPSLGKLTAAPTPLPKAGRPVAPGEHHRSVAAAVSIWLFIVLSLAGGGGFYAYKKGWLLATPGPATGARDSTARDTGAAADSARRADSSGALASAGTGGPGGTGWAGREGARGQHPAHPAAACPRPGPRRRAGFPPAGHPAVPRVAQRRDARSAGVRAVQRGDLQRPGARPREDPAVEPGAQERRTRGRLGAVPREPHEGVINIHRSAFIAPGAA